ncbi:NADP-dependent 3-hydroxy acid dehydrogenase YdfG [Variovorax sp. YR750]|uniref:SDR family oxidoreductase n=1 Tax=Variovorax sp. YR750 TaxID=1884384 RepID=UPI0008B7C5E0|nr:SDR family oxidoreductase [Variovorax sp. YR750]SEM37114.1 NADP-dependent 3-hydroxy acid dehydrogenase YdfG [Variovorax sp. YR750]
MAGALKGQVALVTGGGSGIGRSTALMLAAEGARVVVMGRRLGPLQAVVEEIRSAGGEAWARQADLQEREQLIALVQWTEKEVGPIGILVNNAGLTSRVRNIRWIEPDDWESAMSVNLTAVYVLIQAVLPGMLDAGAGTIVTVSSLAAVRPNLLGGAPYGAAKAAVTNLMGFVHGTFRNNNIRSTTILPGEVDTPIMDTRVRPPSAQERAAMVAPDDVARAILLACTLPQGTTIEQLVISPTRARDQGPDIEISRWLGAPDGTPGKP